MESSAPLDCPMALDALKVPVLLLVDALLSKGYKEVEKTVVHKKGGANIYDAGGLHKGRSYLQCLLDHDRLFKEGAKEFPSKCRHAFYEFIVKPPGLA